MSTPATWLSSRLAAAPPSLRRAIVEALPPGVGATPAGFEDELRATAERLLARAQADAASRETALTLLAADALVTLACEWRAETAPAGLSATR